MKTEILKLLTRDPIVPLFRPFQVGAFTIFMLHRFADDAFGNPGHSIDVLRANLAFLRRHRFRLIGLPDLLQELDEHRVNSVPGVIFTVDDGYGDFARVAAPVFAEFDCPVTVFVTTGFVDRGSWMWWDKIIWAISETTRPSVELQVDRDCYRYGLGDAAARGRAAKDLIERLKRVPDVAMQAAIDDLLLRTDVELPRALPRRFLPMTWGDVSRCASRGVTFGPHTVTHPILSQVDDGRARAELEDSWQRLRSATSAAIPVFCYPNGDYASFTDRERHTLRSMGMRASVLAEQHFTTSRHAPADALQSTVELPRFAYPDDQVQFRQIVAGIERLKQTVRDALTSPPARTRISTLDPTVAR
jgi:peptidoglycan/xylan/chitin deacetylase (PgdA/CDA1 family)